MIFVDESETKSNSRMPSIQNASISPCLEAISGADVMVSPITMPASSETLIREHAESGAILIQFKFGSDFTSSITDERINIALSRMNDVAPKQYQRCICFVGFCVPDSDDGKAMVGTLKGHSKGKAFIHWRKQEPLVDYKGFATIRRRIAMRGGWMLNLCTDAEVPGELKGMENDLLYLLGKPTKELLHLEKYPPDPPDPTDPLQEPIEVKDGRVVLAAFKGIGPAKANSLWDTIYEWNKTQRLLDRGWTEEDWVPTLNQLLVWASMSEQRYKDLELPKASGWGKGMRAKVREQLGLVEGQDLHIVEWGGKE